MLYQLSYLGTGAGHETSTRQAWVYRRTPRLCPALGPASGPALGPALGSACPPPHRVGGGAFGFLRGLVLVGLGYLGYSYYLDEARQPDEVRNAITRPVAAGMANWFQSFTPEEAYIESAPPPAATDEDYDPVENGYDRADRNGLSEIVTTVTTTDEDISADETDTLDSIADILEEDDSQ